MFNSTILDVAIGMIFIYLLLSIMCSAANEMIELILKKRAIDLERGIRELLAPGSDSGKNDIVQRLYNHALINNLFGKTYQESRIDSPVRRSLFRTKLPSYIPARNFALALMDLVALPPDATEGAVTKKEKDEAEASAAAGATPAAPAAGAAAAAATPAAPAADAAAAGAAPETPAEGVPASTARKAPSGASGASVSTRVPVSAAQFVVNLAPPGEGAPPLAPPAGAAPPPLVPAAAAPVPPPPAADSPVSNLRRAIESNPLLEDVSRRSLITLVDAAGNDIAKARENIEGWYNSSMDRVSSWYKRRVQLTIFVIGVFVAIAVNVDTITVAKRLSTDKSLRESLVNAADAYAKANASPTASPSPAASPAAPSPSPNASPSASPNASPSASPEESPSESSASESPGGAPASQSPGASPASQSPGESASGSSGESASKALPVPPECVKDAASKECKEAKRKLACVDEDSDTCKLEDAVQAACEEPDSAACKAAKKVQAECVEPDSDKCKQAMACREPNSIECRQVKACQKDPDSPNCKYLTNEQQLQALGLPIGWDSPDDPKRKWPGSNVLGPGGWKDQFYWHWLGWLLTALAISLGAPFWFDLLNKFIVIRSAVKPHEKSPEEESKD